MTLEVQAVEVHSTVVDSIRHHSQQQADKGGYEAVGFLARDAGGSLIVATTPMHNHAPNPQEGFFVEPWEQFTTEKKLFEKGYEIAGVYHSHVRSEALPSMSDHRMARPEELVIIYSVVFDEVRAYVEKGGTLEPVDLVVKEAE